MEVLDAAAAAIRNIVLHYPKLAEWAPVFAGGSIISLVRSLYDTRRRSAGVLFADAFFSGVGGLLAWIKTDGDLVWTAIIAIAAGGLVMGVRKASNQFADKPFDVFEWVWAILQPWLGRGRE